MTISLLIADDHEVIRTGVKSMLEGSDIQVVAEASTGNQAIEQAVKHHPDVVLLALMNRSETMSGLGVLGLLRFFPQTETLPVLLMSVNHTWLSALAPSLQDMSVGVVSKPFDVEHLWQTIEQASMRV